MNSKEKGDVVVGKAIGYYTAQNNQVLLPIGDKRPYDLVVERDGKLLKVQCKYAGAKSSNGRYIASLRICGGNQSFHTHKAYKPGDFDLLFTMTGDGALYEIPCEETNRLKNCITLCAKYGKYKLGVR